MTLRRYTLMEMMIVIVILCLLSGVVLSRISGTPKRLLVESALNDIRVAFSETALSARATGEICGLVLNPEERKFTRCVVTDDLLIGWKPPVIASEGASALEVAPNYEISSSVEWIKLPESQDWGGVYGIRYLFFPDGEASGPEVSFEILGRKFYWIIDPVLGTATIFEN